MNAKTVATINFKGGVGKTTVTWCLGETISVYSPSRALLFDLDAQMSLTQAIALNDDGKIVGGFESWMDKAIKRKKTIFHALEAFTAPKEQFNFSAGQDFIYKINSKLDFVPSVEDLYWMELDVFDRDRTKDFVRRLCGKISNNPENNKYDYMLFDCPPSFTVLSYSVLSCCDLVLIPVNPDYFASKGVSLILNSLKMRIEPFPIPKIGVFMNKTKTKNGPTKESQFYMREVRGVCDEVAKKQGIKVRFFDAWIPERVGLKRAITTGGVPEGLEGQFKDLWEECVRYINE